MTQKILFFLLILVAFVACKDDDENGFDVPVEFRKISFDRFRRCGDALQVT